MRKFALTMRYYSPRCYDYVRSKFNKNLPHPATIRKWYQQSDVNCSSGICKRNIEIVKAKVLELKNENKDLYCGLVHDEMAVRQHVQWLDDKKQFSGFITYGKIPHDSKQLPIATHVLVFMLSGINVSFNLPIAYYFVGSLQGVDKVILFHSIVKVLHDCGVKLLTMTFDGFSSNITACEIMDCSFDVDDFHPQIENREDKSDIHIFFDPPHMLKLIRGYLGSLGTIYDRDGRPIEWEYFKKLEELRDTENLNTHKLTKEHIQYHRRPMKVSLAAQTLSKSVALSLESLIQRQHPDFKNAAGTAEFAMRMDKLFDILNSDMNRPDNIFKSPINPKTQPEIFSFLNDTEDYIRRLTLEPFRKPLIESEKKMGFKGMSN